MIPAVGFSPGGEPCRPIDFISAKSCFLNPPVTVTSPGGAYIITKKLPERDGEPEYRVKSVNEPYERVVSESQVRLAGD